MSAGKILKAAIAVADQRIAGARWPVACACGLLHPFEQWQGLPFVGIQIFDFDDGEDGTDFYELRNCPCGSTVSQIVAHEDHVLGLVRRELCEGAAMRGALRAVQGRCSELVEENRRLSALSRQPSALVRCDCETCKGHDRAEQNRRREPSTCLPMVDPATGQRWFVDPTIGDDKNEGTEKSPFKTWEELRRRTGLVPTKALLRSNGMETEE